MVCQEIMFPKDATLGRDIQSVWMLAPLGSPGTSESQLSHRKYCKLTKSQANFHGGNAFLKIKFFERLNKTAFTKTKQSTWNSYLCLFMQYLLGHISISQISWEVLLIFAKVSISHRRYYVFQTRCLEALWKLRILKMQYVCSQMLGFLWICNISHLIWAILTSQALLPGSFPPQKWRYLLGGVVEIAILQFPLPDALRRHLEVSGPAFGRLFKNLGFFSASPKRAPRAVWGLFFGLPTFSPFLYICQNA